MPEVELLRLDGERISVRLSASTVGRRGALQLEGDDWGTDVGRVWGKDDYAYVLTVAAEYRDVVLVMLVTELLGSDAGAMQAWLADRDFAVVGGGRGSIADVQVGRRGEVRVERSHGYFVVRASEFDRLTLAVLEALFDSKRFEHDAAFRIWLNDHGIPTEFWSF